MQPRRKKLFSAALRLGICVLAMWFVVRGVAWHDQVWVDDDANAATQPVQFKGRIVEETDKIVVHQGNDQPRSFPITSVANDDKGRRRIEYGLRSAWIDSNKWLVLAAIACTLPVGLFLGIRLKLLLRAQDISLGLWECIKLSFAGNFLNFAAPLGSNAGDLFKAYFVSLHTHRKMEAMTMIALDRMLGLGTLVGVVALITTLSPRESALGPFRNYTLLMLGIGVAGLLLYVSPIARRMVPKLLNRPAAVFGYARRIDEAAVKLFKHIPIMAAAILTTVFLQVFAIGAYALVAKAVSLDVRWSNVPEFFAYFYIGAVVQALPGPPQGLGTVELAYRHFFAPYGGVSQILCMAFVIRIVVLICALPGALVAMTGSYKPKDAIAELEASEESGVPEERDQRNLASVS